MLKTFLFGIALFFPPPSMGLDMDAALDSWFAAQTNLRTWSADFIQTRSLKTLTQPLVTPGHIYMAVPNQFRWELGKPARTIALREKDEMQVIYPALKRAEVYPMGKNAPKEWRDAMALLQAGFPRSRADFEAQFQVLGVAETNSVLRLSLQPRSAAARQMMPELRLELSVTNFSLLSTELSFVDGSRMRSDFTNAVMNPVLDPKLFHWEAPAGFKIVAPLGK
jgi:outer membrane lipoprotein-sorting protein